MGTTTITGGNVGDVLTIGAGGLLNSGPVSGTGTVTSVTSANGAATVATQTTTPVITIVSAPKWTTARTLAGNSVDGSANVAFANKFIVQGTADSGLSGAQFLGSLATGILKNTTTTGALTIAVAADFPILNQSTTGSAATLTTPRAINGVTFDGSAPITVTAAAGTLTGTALNATVVTSSLAAVGTVTSGGLGTGAVVGGVTMTLGSDATGDLYYRSAGGVLTRLAIGSGTQVLGISAGLPAWVAAGGSGGLAVGSSAISGGSATSILYDNAGVLGEYTVTGTGTVVAMQTAPSFVGTITENNNAIGTTITDGLFLQNSTPAAAGAQQQSPSLHLQGQGWKSAATAASQVQDWQIYVLPIQVSAAATSKLIFTWQQAGGGYATTNNIVFNSSPSSSNPAIAFGGINDSLSGFGSQGSGGFSAYTGGTDTMWWASSGTKVNLKSTGVLGWSTSQPTNGTVDTGLARNGAGILEINSGTAGTFRDLKMRQMLTYQSVATAGWGVPAIYGSGRVTAQAAANASIATYTVGAADGTFIVSANVNVTASVTHSFTVTCTYTDETNTSRTLTLSFSQITGTILTSITNVQGVGAYEGVPLHIRCKASTSITVATEAGGTYTSVAYNAEGLITQFS